MNIPSLAGMRKPRCTLPDVARLLTYTPLNKTDNKREKMDMEKSFFLKQTTNTSRTRIDSIKCKTLNIKQYVTHVYKSNSSSESDSE